MPSLFISISGFAACASLIIFSGSRLPKYGEIIAELTGMGKAWFGLVLMAGVTSLPELFTGISSVLIVDSPDIAVGNIMGSCAFNFLILAILDYFVPGKPLFSVVTKSHVLAGFFGMFLITLSVISIVFSDYIPGIGWFSSTTLLLILVYILALRTIFKNTHNNSGDKPVTPTHETGKGITLKLAVKRYVSFALLVIAGAIALPYFADHLAEESGLSKSFVGTSFVAATTSLPEMVAAIAAVRLGSMDIAVGNMFGGILYNILILALEDLMYMKGPLFADVSLNHALSGLVILLMMSVVGIGILFSVPFKRFAMGIDAIILIILYSSLIIALYNMG